jgi:iron(III) transport system permease protein
MRQIYRWLIVAVIGYLLIFPLFMLIRGSVTQSPFAAETVYTLDGFRTVLSDRNFYRAFGNSLILSTLTAIGSLVLGTYFALVATRASVAFRGWITPIMVVVTATPTLFYAISWAMLANTNAGILPKLLASVGLAFVGDMLNAVSWPGLVFVSILKVTGFAYLFLIGPIAAADRSQEDAAVVFGSSRLQAILTVTLPSLAPAYFAVGMLLLVFGIQTFDMPAVLGMPVGINTLSLLVNDYLVINARPDWAAAAASSVLVMLFVAALVAVQLWSLRGKDFVTVGGKAQNGSARPARSLGWAISLSILSFALLALVAPVVQFVVGSFQPFFGLYGTWTLRNYATVLSDPVGVGALRTTLAIVFLAAPITVMAGFLMAYAMLRQPGSVLSVVSRIGSWVPATAPGIVLSVALLSTYINTPGVRALFGTPWLMALALMVGGIPIAVRAAEGMVAQVSPELESAARISGAGPAAAIFGIVARMCAPSLLGAWLLISLWMAGTLDVPMLLQSSNSQTIATYAFGLFGNGQIPEAAAIFLLFLLMLGALVLCVAIGVALAVRLITPRVSISTPA